MEERTPGLAHYIIVKKFYLLTLEISKRELRADKPDIPYYSNHENADGYLPNFPILIKGNGEPWREANLYLVREALNRSADAYKSETFKTKALGLQAFLRWCEDEGIDPLWIPKKERQQPLRRFARHLEQLAFDPRVPVEKRPSSSTLKSRFIAVRAFFEGLQAMKLIPEGSIQYTSAPQFRASDSHTPQNTPVLFTKTERSIIRAGTSGTVYRKTISSSDLNLNVPMGGKSAIGEDGVIDGGTRLFPLLPQHEYFLRQALSEQPNRGYELMCRIALETGARLQTVLTLRIHQFTNLQYNAQGYACIAYGGNGYIADSKYSTAGNLFFKEGLVRDLLTYANSELMIKRRKNSYYGYQDSNGEVITNNYIFLDRKGEPYYTSLAEEAERRESAVDKRVSEKDATIVVNHKGNAIEQFIRDLRSVLKVKWAKFVATCKSPELLKGIPDFPDFTFHDLRATFCMTALRNWYRAVELWNEKHQGEKLVGYDYAVEQVRKLMNHTNAEITKSYVKYELNPHRKQALRNALENNLLGDYVWGDLESDARTDMLEIAAMMEENARREIEGGDEQYESYEKEHKRSRGRKI